MKDLQEAMRPVFSAPTPDDLVILQGALLAAEGDAEARAQALDVAGRFYTYLSELHSKLAARNYSDFASRLDIGAVGAVALENVLSSDGEDLWGRVLLGGLGEALMVAASRQYVKGWEVEMHLVYTQTAWYLANALWQASAAARPDVPAADRWQAITSLLAPARSPDVASEAKAILLGRVFQLLLLNHLVRLLAPADE